MADVKEKAKEDMKVIKFKVLVEELHKYFYHWDGNVCKLSYYPVFVDEYVQDKYVSVVRELLFSTPDELENVYFSSFSRIAHNVLEYIDFTNDGYHYAITSCHACDVFDDNGTPYSYGLIFWLFLLAAVNEDIYNNELSSIIDFAYCLKFDVPMIQDWCHAVEYVLKGNHLTEECDLQCETDAGKKFFLHQEVE